MHALAGFCESGFFFKPRLSQAIHLFTHEENDVMTTAWKPQHLQQLRVLDENVLPVFVPADRVSPSAESYFWDFWPVLTESGELAEIDGTELWMSLSAPRNGDPDQRHHLARLHFHTRRSGVWQDRGHLLPSGFTLGSHEWSGSAIYYPENRELRLFYTVVGESRSPGPSYVQGLAQACGTVVTTPAGISVVDWREQTESVPSDGQFYAVADQVEGEAGFIKAFRDPYYFLDPASGKPYLMFTASVANPTSRFAGAIGIAEADVHTGYPWRLCPSLFEADGVNNELERAHIIYHDDLYYLFWSTQQRTFSPDCAAPTGLYGAVSSSIMGPYQPLNDSGLVLSNPVSAPSQCYAWQVMPDLRVISFIDHVPTAPATAAAGQDLPATHAFVGTVAPEVHLRLAGDRTQLCATPEAGLQSTSA